MLLTFHFSLRFSTSLCVSNCRCEALCSLNDKIMPAACAITLIWENWFAVVRMYFFFVFLALFSVQLNKVRNDAHGETSYLVHTRENDTDVDSAWIDSIIFFNSSARKYAGSIISTNLMRRQASLSISHALLDFHLCVAFAHVPGRVERLTTSAIIVIWVFVLSSINFSKYGQYGLTQPSIAERLYTTLWVAWILCSMYSNGWPKRRSSSLQKSLQ